MEDDVISIFGIPFFFGKPDSFTGRYGNVFSFKKKGLVEENDHIPPISGKSFRKSLTLPGKAGDFLIVLTNVA